MLIVACGDLAPPPPASSQSQEPDNPVAVNTGSASAPSGSASSSELRTHTEQGGHGGTRAEQAVGGSGSAGKGDAGSKIQGGAAGTNTPGASGKCTRRPPTDTTAPTSDATAGAGAGGGAAETTPGSAGVGGASDANLAGEGGTDAGAAGDANSAGASGAQGSQVAEPANALFFSEYVEGSGKLKALEIYASASLTLDGCVVSTYSNGKTQASSKISLKGVLAAGETHVLCSSSLQTLEPNRCQQVANLTFNGNDAIALECRGAILDVIGQIGVDPGEAWQDDAASTASCTLRRNCAVTQGDADGTDAFLPSQQWESFAIDWFGDLGAHSCER